MPSLVSNKKPLPTCTYVQKRSLPGKSAGSMPKLSKHGKKIFFTFLFHHVRILSKYFSVQENE
ncbi:MAG: hypothetical protein OJF51_004197 [Nitrospira sp.]|nr:MAG: hypothetical protein OJF51_004197 [Nitrospira sp.]